MRLALGRERNGGAERGAQRSGCARPTVRARAIGGSWLAPVARMSPHPVAFAVERPARMQRIHVLIRLALLIALGAIGCSSIYWLLYLALPAIVALRISQVGGERYLAEDAPPIVRALRWLAGAYAYLWQLTDALPTGDEGGPVTLQVETGGTPTPVSALLRLLYSLPALVLLGILSMAAAILWIVGAIAILGWQRLPSPLAEFLTLTLRYQFRLVAYHLSLVARYPTLEQADAPAALVPRP